jgi:hypothetical protein
VEQAVHLRKGIIMHVIDYIKNQKFLLTQFELWWVMQNKKNPEVYPMEISDDNAGIWEEMFENFVRDFYK